MKCTECLKGRRYKTTCRKRINSLKNTFFGRAKVSFLSLLHLIFLWMQSPRITRSKISEETGIKGEYHITDWISYLREVCYSVNKKTKLQGQSIDECHLFTRKNHKGLILKVQSLWAIGGMERETGKCFIEVSKTRDAKTLEHIIRENVEEGSTVYTGNWKGYNNISNNCKVKHDTINHSKKFSRVKLVINLSKGTSETKIVTTNHC